MFQTGIQLHINNGLRYVLESLNPSCLQATVASTVANRSSQTVPQRLLWHTSSRPVLLVAPPLSLRAPSVQAKEIQEIPI